MERMDTPPTPVNKAPAAMNADELSAAVRYHNWRYFVCAQPEISDQDFDQLTRLLKRLRPDDPALSELIADPTAPLLEHTRPMLSLDKAYDAATVEKWATAFAGDVIEAPKVDGMAASFHYGADGKLQRALTRGDGVRGELFTANAHYIDAIPKAVPPTGAPFEVRGELYLPLSRFQADFADRFASPRNTCAGAIKLKEPDKTAHYGLSFFTYSVLGRGGDSLVDDLAWAERAGFPVMPYRVVQRGEIQAGYEHWLEQRQHIDYELDGVVYTADAYDEHARLGATAHHPRWAIAYKFQGDSAITTITGLAWSVSRTGAITPIAEVAPVTLSGAQIRRCSLHNLQIIEQLLATSQDPSPGQGLIGAEIIATRRGGVIPHVESVLKNGPGTLAIPETCPVSGHPTIRDGDILKCSQPDACPAVLSGSLEHWLKAVDIEGIGPKLLTQLIQQLGVRKPGDFYRLSHEDLAQLERMGAQSATNVLTAIEARREIPLPTFLASLGITGLGKTIAQSVAEAFGDLDRLRHASPPELAAIYGLGEITADAIVTGLASQEALIDDLLTEIRVPPLKPAAAPAASLPLSGRSVVFTGRLATMTRTEAQKRVQAQGGQTPSSVTKSLDFLIIGDANSALRGESPPSSKHKRAEALIAAGAPIRILSEAMFDALLDGTLPALEPDLEPEPDAPFTLVPPTPSK